VDHLERSQGGSLNAKAGMGALPVGAGEDT